MVKRILAMTVLLMLPGPAFGQLLSTVTQTTQQTTKIAPDLQGSNLPSSVDCIVQFNQSPTISMLQQIALLGGVLKSTFTVINAALYTLPVSLLSSVAALSTVTYISPDRGVGLLLDNSAAAVNASAAWNAGWDGAGIGVAIIDSGISNHPDLDSPNGTFRVVYSKDFVGTGPNDQYGHGDHVAGIAAGNAASSTCSICTRKLRGIAPRASLINLRVLDQNGQGKDSLVLAAIQQALGIAGKYNVRVINLSLGRPVIEGYQKDPLCKAVESAWQKGIAVVVAAGNDGRDNSAGTDGYGTIDSPGNDPYVITVGAMKTMGTPARTDDLIASYSSKGPTMIDHIVKPDIVAPGNLVVSLLAPNATLAAAYPQTLIPLSYYEQTNSATYSGTYFRLSGTSMATPVVSGAVADLLEAEPSLTPDQVKAKLMLTAYKNFPSTSTATDPTTGQVYTSQYDMFTVGAGYLDIQAALADNNTATGTAMSPTATYDSSSGNVYLVMDSSAVWSTSPVWDMRSVWGTGQFVGGTRSVWGTQSVWGTSGTQGFQSVWGTRSVWGTGTGPTEATSVSVNGEN